MVSAPEILPSRSLETVALERAVVRTVAYSDVFEYPLRAPEVHRYLHEVTATFEATAAALARCAAPGGALSHREGFYMLRGKEHLVEERRARAARAARLWPKAVRYGHMIAGLPFVRLVAVTGSLAWDNVSDTSDIDYLIVTEPGRLWVSRWIVAALGRLARLDGVTLCPNYVVTKRALVIAERDLYIAYELARMTPIAGRGLYRRMRRDNPWTRTYLPNAVEPPSPPDVYLRRWLAPRSRVLTRLTRVAEGVLRSRLGAALEGYEMRYRIRKLVRNFPATEATYGVDWYKALTIDHRPRALAAFAARLRTLNATP